MTIALTFEDFSNASRNLLVFKIQRFSTTRVQTQLTRRSSQIRLAWNLRCQLGTKFNQYNQYNYDVATCWECVASACVASACVASTRSRSGADLWEFLIILLDTNLLSKWLLKGRYKKYWNVLDERNLLPDIQKLNKIATNLPNYNVWLILPSDRTVWECVAATRWWCGPHGQWRSSARQMRGEKFSNSVFIHDVESVLLLRSFIVNDDLVWCVVWFSKFRFLLDLLWKITAQLTFGNIYNIYL